MPLNWQDGPRGDELPPVWLTGLLFAAAVLVAAVLDAQPSLVQVDAERKRIVISRLVDDGFVICDGPDGACVPLWNLREATAAIRPRR